MSSLTDNQQKHLDYLLADFAAIKAEIARRSSLQRVVLAGYIALLAVVFQQAVSRDICVPWIAAVWAASALGFQFCARENLEIERLATVIRTRIAPVAGQMIGAQAETVLPSETNAEVPETLRRCSGGSGGSVWASQTAFLRSEDGAAYFRRLERGLKAL